MVARTSRVSSRLHYTRANRQSNCKCLRGVTKISTYIGVYPYKLCDNMSVRIHCFAETNVVNDNRILRKQINSKVMFIRPIRQPSRVASYRDSSMSSDMIRCRKPYGGGGCRRGRTHESRTDSIQKDDRPVTVLAATNCSQQMQMSSHHCRSVY